MDVGSFKMKVSPDKATFALVMDAGAIDTLSRIVARSVPRSGDAPASFKARHDAVSGALQAARWLMDGGKS